MTQRDPQRAIRRMVKEANSLGLTVRFDPIEQAHDQDKPADSHGIFVSTTRSR